MAHFHVGDRTLLHLLPLAIFPDLQLLRLRHPAVALAEDADEERLHAINPLPAVFPGVGGFAVGVLGGYQLQFDMPWSLRSKQPVAPRA